MTPRKAPGSWGIPSVGPVLFAHKGGEGELVEEKFLGLFDTGTPWEALMRASNGLGEYGNIKVGRITGKRGWKSECSRRPQLKSLSPSLRYFTGMAITREHLPTIVNPKPSPSQEWKG